MKRKKYLYSTIKRKQKKYADGGALPYEMIGNTAGGIVDTLGEDPEKANIGADIAGGALKGAGKGAAAGAAVGAAIGTAIPIPIVGTVAGGVGGAIIGGLGGLLAGGTGGYIKGRKEQKEIEAKQEAREEARANAQEQLMQAKRDYLSSWKPGNTPTYTMENGGYLPGNLTEYSGMPHEYGGIPLGETNNEVENGETRNNDFIFSNNIKLPGKKRLTFAHQSKRIENKYGLRENDDISKSAKQKELDDLKMLQENVKSERDGKAISNFEKRNPGLLEQYRRGGLLNYNFTYNIPQHKTMNHNYIKDNRSSAIRHYQDMLMKATHRRYEDGGEMPFGMPLKSANPYIMSEYNQPMVGNTILPDPNRPNLPNTNSTEYKIGIEADGNNITIPTIVNGQYLSPDNAVNRYKLTGEKFKEMSNPSSYSQFYDYINRLKIMQPNKYANGGHLSSAKAREILHDGTTHGQPITEKQKRYFGYIASLGKKKMINGGEGEFDPYLKKNPYVSTEYDANIDDNTILDEQPTTLNFKDYRNKYKKTFTDTPIPPSYEQKATIDDLQPMSLGYDVEKPKEATTTEGNYWNTIPTASKIGMIGQGAAMLGKGLLLAKRNKYMPAKYEAQPTLDTPMSFERVRGEEPLRQAELAAASYKDAIRKNAVSSGQLLSNLGQYQSKDAMTRAAIAEDVANKNASIQQGEAMANYNRAVQNANIIHNNLRRKLEAEEINQREYDSVTNQWNAYLSDLATNIGGITADLGAYSRDKMILEDGLLDRNGWTYNPKTKKYYKKTK